MPLGRQPSESWIVVPAIRVPGSRTHGATRFTVISATHSRVPRGRRMLETAFPTPTAFEPARFAMGDRCASPNGSG